MARQQITFEKHWEDKDFTDFGAFTPQVSQQLIAAFKIEEPTYGNNTTTDTHITFGTEHSIHHPFTDSD